MKLYSEKSLEELKALGAPISSLISAGVLNTKSGKYTFNAPDNSIYNGTSLKTLTFFGLFTGGAVNYYLNFTSSGTSTDSGSCNAQGSNVPNITYSTNCDSVVVASKPDWMTTGTVSNRKIYSYSVTPNTTDEERTGRIVLQGLVNGEVKATAFYTLTQKTGSYIDIEGASTSLMYVTGEHQVFEYNVLTNCNPQVTKVSHDWMSAVYSSEENKLYVYINECQSLESGTGRFGMVTFRDESENISRVISYMQAALPFAFDNYEMEVASNDTSKHTYNLMGGSLDSATINITEGEDWVGYSIDASGLIVYANSINNTDSSRKATIEITAADVRGNEITKVMTFMQSVSADNADANISPTTIDVDNEAYDYYSLDTFLYNTPHMSGKSSDWSIAFPGTDEDGNLTGYIVINPNGTGAARTATITYTGYYNDVDKGVVELTTPIVVTINQSA